MDGFQIRKIHEPVLDEETRGIIGGETGGSSGGGGFYSKNKWFIWAIVIGLLIIGVLVYLVFFKGPVMTSIPAKINLSIDVPSNISAGGEVVVKFRVENQDTKTLAPGQLEVVLPEGSTFLQSTPPSTDQNGTLYSVPELVANQNAVIFVKFKAQGGVGDSRKVSAKYSYRFSGVSSEFVKEATSDVQLTASDVGIEWNGPVNTNRSQLVEYTLSYKNSSSRDIAGSRIQVNYPDGFQVGSTSPNADLNGNTWSIGRLTAGQSGSIKIQGTYTEARPGETKNMKAEFLVLSSSGTFFVQGNSTFSTLIASTPLSLVITPDSATASILRPGGRPNFQVDFANNSDRPVSSVNISVTIDSKAVDLSTLTSDGGVVSGNTITWNASSSGLLENLAPNGRGQFRFGFAVRNPAVKDNSKNIDVKISSKIVSQEYSSPFPGNQLSLKVATVGQVTSQLTLNSGANPPKVDKLTTYTVTLSLKNSTNDITDGVLTAFMPINPQSFDKGSLSPRDASNVKFDPATGKIIWNTGLLPSGSGSFVPAKTLVFKINLTPVASQANKSVQLLKDITFSGRDGFTSEQITLTTEPVSTQDADNNSAGLVLP